jgi:hypothetical protein
MDVNRYRAWQQASNSSTDQGGGKRRGPALMYARQGLNWKELTIDFRGRTVSTGGRKGLESAAHTAKPSARAETGGFAFCPRKCQLPGRHRWGCRTGNGRGDSNLRPPCVVTRDEGPSPTTKTYAPRSRPQGAFLRRWNRPIISFVLGLSQHQRPGAPGIEAISG